MGYVLEAAYQHGKAPSILRSADDINRFIEELLDAGWEYTAATVYAVEEGANVEPDHELLVGADATTGLGGLRYAGGGDWYSAGERTNPDGVEFAYFGTGHTFPANAEVPLETVRTAMRELLESGGQRPSSVTWQQAD